MFSEHISGFSIIVHTISIILSDGVLKSASLIMKKLEDSIARIIKLPVRECTKGMNKLVEDISQFEKTHFKAGLLEYLFNPTRRLELFNKDIGHPAPSMTKPEQVLLYILNKLKEIWPNICNSILDNIEFRLFRLTKTASNPSNTFDMIESVTHFYAVVCRYIDDKTRLRIFMLSSMYCFQYKTYPIIFQCVQVWMHVLPLAHMGMGK